MPDGRWLPATALILATIAAGGCGKGQYRPSTTRRPSASRPALRSSVESERDRAGHPVTPPRARAFGHAVNLSLVDIPGATLAPDRRSPEPEDRETRRCGGAVSDAGAVQIKSPDFVRGVALTREAISSRVTVLSSGRLARASVTSLGRPSWLACYERVLRRRFAGGGSSGVRVDTVTVSRVPVALAAVGADMFGIRILARLTSLRSRLSINLYLDVFGFALGPADIDLDATSYVQPVANRTEQDLLRLMYLRALAHPL